MSLTRVWMPTGSYSGGSKKRLIVIHTMEGFTGANGAYDCAKYFQGNVGASSQVCIDNNRGKVWEGVTRAYGSWTQCNFNSVSVSAEQSGYASWSRDYWLSNRDAQLHNVADYIAEESKALGIPITLLSDSQAQGGSAGVTFHSRLGSSGCGHGDPGSNWPVNEVLAWAKGGTTTTPIGGDMAPAVAIWDNKEYYAWVDGGKIMYRGPDTQNKPVVIDSSAGASGGCDMSISPSGWTFITFMNNTGDPWVERRAPGGSGGWERFPIG